jgi:hypothetical protein
MAYLRDPASPRRDLYYRREWRSLPEGVFDLQDVLADMARQAGERRGAYVEESFASSFRRAVRALMYKRGMLMWSVEPWMSRKRLRFVSVSSRGATLRDAPADSRSPDHLRVKSDGREGLRLILRTVKD